MQVHRVPRFLLSAGWSPIVTVRCAGEALLVVACRDLLGDTSSIIQGCATPEPARFSVAIEKVFPLNYFYRVESGFSC